MNVGDVLKSKYTITDKIGNGKFGIVFKALDNKNNVFAVKTENSVNSIKLLKNETTILKYLYDHGCRNIPIVYWYGIYEHIVCLTMTYYEQSINDYIKTKQLPVEKVDLITISAINIIESIHKNYVLHRDIKPQNFMLKDGELYLIDFGLATFYIDETREHLTNIGSHDSIIGTPKYVSYNIHDGQSYSRRDDLISLLYMYFYLCYGELPWDNLKTDTFGDNYEEIHILHYKNKQRKLFKSPDYFGDICSKINQKIYKFMNYCYGLKYDEIPNYEGLKLLFASEKSV